MSDRTRGMYRKFDVRRTDGSSEFGGKHQGCDYFVLDCHHDKFSIAAMMAYADACRSEFPQLADDIVRKVSELTVRFASVQTVGASHE